MSCKTGNIAIEFWNPKKNKPSGINVTTSDFWIYCLGNPLETYLISVERLKEFVEQNKPFRIIDVGGDDNASLMLYKKDAIISQFIRIDNIDKDELNWLLNEFISNRNSMFFKKELDNADEE